MRNRRPDGDAVARIGASNLEPAQALGARLHRDHFADVGDNAREHAERNRWIKREFRAISELYRVAAVVLVMNVVRQFAKYTGSDERAMIAGIISLTAAVGGAVALGVILP
jgi:hypothetical protein